MRQFVSRRVCQALLLGRDVGPAHDLEAQRADVKSKSGILVDAVAAVRNAGETLGAAGFEKGEAESAQKKFSEEKEMYLEVQKGDFQALKLGLEEDEDVKTMHLTTLSDRLTRIDSSKEGV